MPIVFFLGIGGWLWKEGVPVQYAVSVVLARLNLVEVPEPKMAVMSDKRFAIGRYEVAFKEYDQFAKLTWGRLPPDQGWGRGDRPVSSVSWEDAVAFAKWLSKATGKNYRLPTEEEWEYAATSGGKDERWSGTSRAAELSDHAWYLDNSDEKTHPVGGKRPNGFGLYDMTGNVWEWMQDCWPDDCRFRVVRGGAWNNSPEVLGLSFRLRAYPDGRNSLIGFRLAQDVG
jgi:formylglycine-generating enzyme required for sulfatase activity